MRIGYDNNGDGDIGDDGDDIQIDDAFTSNVVSLSYDHNGNLTDDGIHKYIYDAWNRLVEVTRRVDDEDTVAEYEYDGLYRRIEKAVTNSGEGVVPGSDAGGTGICPAGRPPAGGDLAGRRHRTPGGSRSGTAWRRTDELGGMSPTKTHYLGATWKLSNRACESTTRTPTIPRG